MGLAETIRADELRSKVAAWEPPAGWRLVSFVDAHTAGEPLRILLDGFEGIAGKSMLARRSEARRRCDRLRRALMWEPRGHRDMYGCAIMPPVTERAEVAVLFMHNEGFSTMCGHGIVAVATVLVEIGLVPARDGAAAIGIDTPAGFVEARVRVGARRQNGSDEGRKGAGGARRLGRSVEEVAFTNVPSFVVDLGREVELPGVGKVSFDLAFGGAFYAYVDARQLGLRLAPDNVDEIVRLGRVLKSAAARSCPPRHPVDPELGFLYGTIFTDGHRGEPAEGGGPVDLGRHVCVFADGELDRSPTGTGVSGRLAILHARGELEVGESIEVDGIVDEAFGGRVLRTARVGQLDAVVPEITGRAHVTGRGEFLIDPRDPLAEGFLLG